MAVKVWFASRVILRGEAFRLLVEISGRLIFLDRGMEWSGLVWNPLQSLKGGWSGFQDFLIYNSFVIVQSSRIPSKCYCCDIIAASVKPDDGR